MTEGDWFDRNRVTLRIERWTGPGYMFPEPMFPEPTPEERAEREAKHRAEVAEFETARGRWAVLMTDEDQPKVLRDLLAMHAPTLFYGPDSSSPTRRTWVQCDDCGDGDDNAMWPCNTARVVAEHYDIEVPPWGRWLLVREVLPD